MSPIQAGRTFEIIPSRMRSKIRLVEKADGTFDCDSLGVSLDCVAEVAIKVAPQIRRDVKLHFNSTLLTISAYDTPDEVLERFHAELDRQRAEWLASPAGQAETQRRARELASHREAATKLISDLAGLTKGAHTAAVRWIRDFQDAADCSGAVDDYTPVLLRLQELGYFSGDYVIPKDTSEERKLRLQDELKVDPVKGAKYIIGQAMSMMAGGMPPHPVVHSHAEDYLQRFSVLDDVASV